MLFNLRFYYNLALIQNQYTKTKKCLKALQSVLYL